MSSPAAVDAPPARPRGAQGTVRRVIVFTILFVLVIIAASGISGLLGRLLETRPEFGDGAGGLALSLAFTVIGGTLAVVVWWFVWRRLDGDDRSSVAWGLYLAAMSFVSLAIFTVAALSCAADAVAGRWSPDALAVGITWLAVWIAHRLMRANSTRSPLRLTTVPAVLGAAFGLIVGATGAIRVLSSLFDEALMVGAAAGSSWWMQALQSLVWALGGALVWWWHWAQERARLLDGGLADVMLVLSGVLLAGATAVGGVGTALYVGLRVVADRSDPWRDLLDPLALALAAAAVGLIVWMYHRRIAAERSAGVRAAARLVEAGIGLVAAASGVGVVVNALLAGVTTPLAGTDGRSLLLGGLASILVGAPLWWVAWRPNRAASDAGAAGRRVYLIAVFGVSAIVAIVAVLVVGYRIFEFALDSSGESIIERIRAPFGLLLATGLVSAYHFSVWRHDRQAAPQVATARRIERIILVSAGGEELSSAVRAVTGAGVTHWEPADVGAPSASVSSEAVVEALEGIVARRVLVVVSAAGEVQVIPLAD